MNGQQMELFPVTGSELRDQGIKKAEDHANEVHDDWSEKAMAFLKKYMQNHPVFLAEDVREASSGFVPEAPHARAWGSVMVKAKKAGLIDRLEYVPVKNPKAHRALVSKWIRI